MTITSCIARSTAAVVIYLRRYAVIVDFRMFRAVQRISQYISACFVRPVQRRLRYISACFEQCSEDCNIFPHVSSGAAEITIYFRMFRPVQRRSWYISVSYERCGGGHDLFPPAAVCRKGQRLHRYCVVSLLIYLLLNNNIIILGKYPFCYILFSLSLSNFAKLLNPTTYLHFETTVVIVLFPHNKTKFNYLKQTFLSKINCFKNMYEIVPNVLIGSLSLYLFKALQSSHEEFGIGIKNRDLIFQELK